MKDKKFIILLVFITVIGFLLFPVFAINRRDPRSPGSPSRLERNREKKKIQEKYVFPPRRSDEEIARLEGELSIQSSRIRQLENRIKQLDGYIIKLESYIIKTEQYLKIIQVPFEPDTGKPQFGKDIRYKSQIPIILFPQVFERDLSESDYSVSGAMFLGTIIVPKGSILTIENVKYCKRTQSWWFEVNATEPPTFSMGHRQHQEKYSGWLNYDALIEYPLLPIHPERPKKPT